VLYANKIVLGARGDIMSVTVNLFWLVQKPMAWHARDSTPPINARLEPSASSIVVSLGMIVWG